MVEIMVSYSLLFRLARTSSIAENCICSHNPVERVTKRLPRLIFQIHPPSFTFP